MSRRNGYVRGLTQDEANQLQKGFVAWTEAEPSWRALALVGSWARGVAREDSDLDLVVLTDQPASWTADEIGHALSRWTTARGEW